MLAVIKIGGKQYKIEKGKKFETEKLPHKEGEKFNIDKVLLLENGNDLKIGTPLVEGAFIEAKVVAHKKGDKQIIFKKKAKKRYQRTHGYRKEITIVEVLEIHTTGGNVPVLKTEKTETLKSGTKKSAVKKTTIKKPAAKKKAPTKKEA